MVTISRKNRYQLNLNSTRIGFDVKKLTTVSETMVYSISVHHKKFAKRPNENVWYGPEKTEERHLK